MSEKKLSREELIEKIKELSVDDIKEIIYELLSLDKLDEKAAEVMEKVESSSLYQKYDSLSKSRQKYLLAGISLVVGIVIGYFI